MERKLIAYLPYVVRKYDIFQAITIGEQPEFDMAWHNTDTIRNEQYLFTAEDIGLRRWERILGIQPKDTDTIAYRRDRILSRLNEKLPYTLKQLRKMLDALCGKAHYSIYLSEYTLFVSVSVIAKNRFADVVSLLERITPQNIFLDIQQQYNSWGAVRNAATWRQAQSGTWQELKEEVL